MQRLTLFSQSERQNEMMQITKSLNNKANFYIFFFFSMLYRRNGTASVQIDLGQNDGSRTTVYPGGLIDIPDTVARDLKNLYGADLAVADDEDRTQKTEVSLTS